MEQQPNKFEPQAQNASSENPLDVAADLDQVVATSDTSLVACDERHDGWTGQRMAMFCSLLADTGIVTDACEAVGMTTGSAYGARRRNPLFAAAWEEAISIARERLADALLARSLEGSVERYYRDGELVGEKRLIDNRLGMAILRRLDRKAEAASVTLDTVRRRASDVTLDTPDWDLMLTALRTGDEGMIADALAEAGKLEGHKVSEVSDPPIHTLEGDNFEEEDASERCWKDEDGWWTDFPPPSRFAGYQEGRWGDEDYKRACTGEETRALEAALDAELADERCEDEALRDSWFAQLNGAAADGAPEPGSGSTEAAGDDPHLTD